ncbi:hypothetical protein AX14_007946, partial [Amanita brunnescens Koide BX004]
LYLRWPQRPTHPRLALKLALIPLVPPPPWKFSQRSLMHIASHAATRLLLARSAPLALSVAGATNSTPLPPASSFVAPHARTSLALHALLLIAAHVENLGSLATRQHSSWPLDSEAVLAQQNHPRRAPALHRNPLALALSLRHTPKGTPQTPSPLRVLFKLSNVHGHSEAPRAAAPSPSSNLPPAPSALVPIFSRPELPIISGLTEDIPTAVPSRAPSRTASIVSSSSVGDAGIAELLQPEPFGGERLSFRVVTKRPRATCSQRRQASFHQ